MDVLTPAPQQARPQYGVIALPGDLTLPLDLEAMARPLHCMLWCLERTGDTDGCRAVIARIRRVYAAPRWKDQGPLRYAAVVEQRLEGGEL